MRLLYLADIRFPMERANGIQTIETCHALARAGVNVELVVRRSDGRADEDCLAFFGLEPHPRLTLRRLPVGGRTGFIARSISRLIRGRRNDDAVYTRDLVLADLALATGRFHGLPVFFEAHTVAAVFARERAELYEKEDRPSPRKLARLERRERRVCRNAAGLVAITEALLRCLEKEHGPIAPGRVVRDGFRAPTPRLLEPRSRTVYYVGQLYPWKGVDVLVEAMQYVHGADLVVVGGLPPEPDLDRVQALARELGLSERVRFLGYLPPPRAREEMERAGLFVVPLLDTATARLFTSPLKLFEAMAAARPIVASDLPSIREVLTHEENALLVPPGDAKVLAAAIQRLVTDDDLASRLAARAQKDASGYSWERRAEAIEDFVGDVLSDQSSSSTSSEKRPSARSSSDLS